MSTKDSSTIMKSADEEYTSRAKDKLKTKSEWLTKFNKHYLCAGKNLFKQLIFKFQIQINLICLIQLAASLISLYAPWVYIKYLIFYLSY